MTASESSPAAPDAPEIMLPVVHETVFELVGGCYTNGLSAMAASIVLLQQTHQHGEIRQLHRQPHDVLGALHARQNRLEGPSDEHD